MSEHLETLKQLKALYAEEGLHSVWTLLGVAVILAFVFSNVHAPWVYSVAVISFWLFFWVIAYIWVPRNKKDKVGIVIAIETERASDERRFKSDFIERIQKTLDEHGLGQKFQIITIKRHQCRYFRRVRWQKWLAKRVRGHFYLIGTVKRRPEPGNGEQLFIELEGKVIHRLVPIQISQNLALDFVNVLPKEIKLNADAEFHGFRLTADVCSYAAMFIIGIASLISGDAELALDLHTKCLNAIQPHKDWPMVKYMNSKLGPLMTVSRFLLAKKYYVADNIALANQYCTSALAINAAYYPALMLQGSIDLKLGDVTAALVKIKRAKKHATDDTWLFSLAFLYFWTENYVEALKLCNKIQKLDGIKMKSVVDECLKFNEPLKAGNPDKKQLYFWTGFLQYFLAKNLPESLSDLETFKNASQTNADELDKLAARYIKEIQKTMSLK